MATSPSTITPNTHAIVIGGSMAGLLAARVLSDRFAQVTIIERDQLPDSAEFRGGVPQARHLHTLLVRGQQIIEELFPGFEQDIKNAGSVPIAWGQNTNLVTSGGFVRHFHSTVRSNSFGRASLEWLVRNRVQRVANIAFLQEAQVEALLTSADRSVVTGVRVLSRRNKTTQDLAADFVVDASGRTSKAGEWLTTLGYEAPDETVINAHTGYATRWFEAPENLAFKGVSYVVQPRASEGLYRGGGVMQVEGNQWVLTLVGANADYPPTDEDGFLEFARTTATPVLYNFIKGATPISPIYGYRRLENRMLHYEKLARRPENFIVTGDAAVAFNPVYGQGMTAAALDALLLRDTLAKYDVRQLKGLAQEFQKRLHKLAQDPWLLATGEDMRYPDVVGAKPNLMTRLIHKYFDRVALAMPYDGVIGLRFVEVINMLKPPTALLTPGIMLRVWRHNALPHRTPATNDVRMTGEFTMPA